MNSTKINSQTQGQRLKELFKLAKPYTGRMILSGLLAIIGQIVGLVPFFVIYLLVTRIHGDLPGVTPRFIYALVGAAAASLVCKHVFLSLSTQLSHATTFNILHDLRIRITETLGRLPLGYFNRKATGTVKKILGEDVDRLELFLAHGIPEFTGAFLYLVIATAALFVMDWRLAIATMIAIPAGLFFQALTIGGARDFMGHWFQATEEMNAAMVEYVQGMPVIKAFNHTVESFSKYSGSIERCVDLENDTSRRWYLPMTLFSLSLTVNMLFILPVGALLYLYGSINLGMFVFFLLIGVGYGNPVRILLYFGRNMERNLEGMGRITEVLETDPLPEAAVPEAPGQGITGNQVEFSYDERTNVLDKVDFSVARGKFLALVGPSGAGKTTLARLIPRFWDVNAGSISLGETDVRNVTLAQLMDQFGLIFQNIHLFNDTVRNNLRLGDPQATDTEIEAAARAAHCHEVILSLPLGYDTIVGEKGANLSGGEKQRLSIARALLKDAPILVVDEATAYIDPENEALVQEAINNLVRDKTLLVIAHRLSTITEADEILVLDKGKVAARGTHEHLLSDSPLYRTMWDAHMAAQNWTFSLPGESR